MSQKEFQNLCRLCKATDNLVWIFDERITAPENIKDVIFKTTGVEIHSKDLISQKVCSKCCEITIKMNTFRNTAQRNDAELKAKCHDSLKYMDLKLPHSDITVKRDVASTSNSSSKIKHRRIIHPTAMTLNRKYPDIVLPEICLTSHLLPVVVLDQVDVGKYNIRNNDTPMSQQSILSERAKSPKKQTARKKTSTSLKNTRVKRRTDVMRSIDENIITVKFKGREVSPEASKPKRQKSGDMNKNGTVINSLGKPIITKKQPGNEPQKVEEGLQKFSFTRSPRKSSSDSTDVILIHEDDLSKPLADEDLMDTTVNHLKNQPEEPLALSYSHKSIPTYVCTICNEVYYDMNELKIHKKQHTRCPFCKISCSTIEEKSLHVEKYCVIREMMNNPLYIELYKVELNREILEKYPQAFKNFASLQTEKNGVARESNNFKTIAPALAAVTSELTKIPPNTTLPVITSVTSECPGVKEVIKYNTVSIVKPDIKLKSHEFLDAIDVKSSENKIIKELIRLCGDVRNRSSKDSIIQTELALNSNITINKNEKVCEFKGLRRQLQFYKIPVVIKDGKFNVVYDFHTKKKPSKPLNLWTDLPIVCLKPPTHNYQSILKPRMPSGALPLKSTKAKAKPNGNANTTAPPLVSLLPATTSNPQNPVPMANYVYSTASNSLIKVGNVPYVTVSNMPLVNGGSTSTLPKVTTDVPMSSSGFIRVKNVQELS